MADMTVVSLVDAKDACWAGQKAALMVVMVDLLVVMMVVLMAFWLVVWLVVWLADK